MLNIVYKNSSRDGHKQHLCLEMGMPVFCQAASMAG